MEIFDEDGEQASPDLDEIPSIDSSDASKVRFSIPLSASSSTLSETLARVVGADDWVALDERPSELNAIVDAARRIVHEVQKRAIEQVEHEVRVVSASYEAVASPPTSSLMVSEPMSRRVTPSRSVISIVSTGSSTKSTRVSFAIGSAPEPMRPSAQHSIDEMTPFTRDVLSFQPNELAELDDDALQKAVESHRASRLARGDLPESIVVDEQAGSSQPEASASRGM